MWRALLLIALILSAAIDPAVGQEPRFRPVDLFIDSADRPLAAYQVEIVVTSGDAQVVGVEGGEPAAFRTPPYYDPAALMTGRIILAAFNIGNDLPRGKTRVATLHVRETSEGTTYATKVMAAASAAGAEISVTASVESREGDR